MYEILEKISSKRDYPRKRPVISSNNSITIRPVKYKTCGKQLCDLTFFSSSKSFWDIRKNHFFYETQNGNSSQLSRKVFILQKVRPMIIYRLVDHEQLSIGSVRK